MELFGPKFETITSSTHTQKKTSFSEANLLVHKLVRQNLSVNIHHLI